MYLRIWLESFLVFLVMSDVKNTGGTKLRSLMV